MDKRNTQETFEQVDGLCQPDGSRGYRVPYKYSINTPYVGAHDDTRVSPERKERKKGAHPRLFLVADISESNI